MFRWLFRCVALGVLLCSSAFGDATDTYSGRVFPFIENYCLDCHDSAFSEADLNLEAHEDASVALRSRRVWKSVYDRIEAGMMPPPKRRNQPTSEERTAALRALDEFLAAPDPDLNARDPGRPVLRRLNRLEYNNSVRDLLGLDVDIFMFPERLPVNKSYFDPNAGRITHPLEIRVREYGQKYAVLLARSGLPGDNRAAHGFNNRGDSMNLSPLQLEKYVALAGEIARRPELPYLSSEVARLFGVDASNPPPQLAPRIPTADDGPVSVVRPFAPQLRRLSNGSGGSEELDGFRESVSYAFDNGLGGVFDVPASMNNSTVLGKGGLIKAVFGPKTLTINPNADLWLVSFATAHEVSGGLLIANKEKGETVYELTFDIRGGEEFEGITRLGLCALGRRGQSGTVTLSAIFSNGTTVARSVEISDDPTEAAFFTFDAAPGERIRKLKVDGSRFSGDYVLIDDIGFETSGRPLDRQERLEVVETDSDREEADAAPAVAVEPPERIRAFLRKAFRGRETSEDVARYVTLFETLRRRGASESEAMRGVLQGALSSPKFLFIAEPGIRDAAPVRDLSGHELATRLSYFLWSTMPDTELFKLADRGELRGPEILEAQVRRMLRDQKVRELSESFAVQWLRLDQLYTAKPDRKLYSDFYRGPQGKNTLHASMLVEALLLFETILIEDRSVLDLLFADYTWLNTRLIELYGYENALGSAIETALKAEEPGALETTRELQDVSANLWFRVEVPDETRGGYLTMAAPLTVTSLPFRTSPVKRGAWVLETLFNRPPPEPKVAFVLEEADEPAQAEPATVRQMFERHRSDAACYTCHVRLDPPGFALESFSPIGAWREFDGQTPIDSSGEWNGAPYQDANGFKKALRDSPAEFLRGFTEHLLSYALSRELEYYDQAVVDEIVAAVKADDYRFSRLVVEIVLSEPFRKTRNTFEPFSEIHGHEFHALISTDINNDQ